MNQSRVSIQGYFYSRLFLFKDIFIQGDLFVQGYQGYCRGPDTRGKRLHAEGGIIVHGIMRL